MDFEYQWLLLGLPLTFALGSSEGADEFQRRAESLGKLVGLIAG